MQSFTAPNNNIMILFVKGKKRQTFEDGYHGHVLK